MPHRSCHPCPVGEVAKPCKQGRPYTLRTSCLTHSQSFLSEWFTLRLLSYFKISGNYSIQLFRFLTIMQHLNLHVSVRYTLVSYLSERVSVALHRQETELGKEWNYATIKKHTSGVTSNSSLPTLRSRGKAQVRRSEIWLRTHITRARVVIFLHVFFLSNSLRSKYARGFRPYSLNASRLRLPWKRCVCIL